MNVKLIVNLLNDWKRHKKLCKKVKEQNLNK